MARRQRRQRWKKSQRWVTCFLFSSGVSPNLVFFIQAESTPKAKATKKNGKVKSNPTLESEDEAEAEKPKESASSKKAAPESQFQSSFFSSMGGRKIADFKWV